MPLFFQKDVPLVVTILIAAWTWLISQNIQQTNDLQVIEYQYNYEGNPAQLLFRNISQSKSIKNIRILVSCKSRKDCFTSHDNFAGTSKFVPPFGVIPTEEAQAPPSVNKPRAGSSGTKSPNPANEIATQAYFTFSLTTDAAIALVLNNKRSNERLDFALINSDQFEKLKVLDENSCAAFYYRNYSSILFGLLISASLLVALLFMVFGKEPDRATNVVSTYSVNLTVRTKTETEQEGDAA